MHERSDNEAVVWVFNSSEAASAFPSGVWRTKETAEEWIHEVRASGTLSAYVLDESAWESNVRMGHLKLSKPERATIAFMRRFTTAIDHAHYEDGRSASQGAVSVCPVQLGRDEAVRPFQDLPGGRRFECVCCGQYTLERVDECDICGNCGWEDWYECHDSAGEVIRPNYVSLTVAREVVKRFGPAALCSVNRASGVTIEDLAAMSREQLQSLQTLDQEHGRTHSE
jgi:hypothetical protein